MVDQGEMSDNLQLLMWQHWGEMNRRLKLRNP